MSTMEDLQAYVDGLPPWGKAVAAGGAALLIYAPYKYFTSMPRKSPVKEDFKKGYVYLYQFPRTTHVPSISPYCLKLETWLRMADIDYENVPATLSSSMSIRSKEGTLPFVELDGKEYYDSAFIIRDLTVEKGVKLDEHLSEEQHAVSRAMEKMVENSLMFSWATCRMEHTNEVVEQFPPHLFGPFYFVVKAMMRNSFMSKTASFLAGSGIGRHTRDERVSIGVDDLRAISKYIGSKHYATGFKPTSVDACIFSVLAQIVYAPYEIDHLVEMKKDMQNLIDYTDRIKQRFWPDWDECVHKFKWDSWQNLKAKKSSPKPTAPALD